QRALLALCVSSTDGFGRKSWQELAEFEKNSPDWCTVGSVDDDLMHWNAMLAGPGLVIVPGQENTPYSGGVFNIDLQFPSEYPFKAPKNWGPTLNVLHCLTAIKQILEQPDVDNPLEPEIAKQMQDSRAAFDKTAQEWTKQYAS
ncbi:hypothetical protein BBJ28_00011324, partial [Nothophytophthora sp. Chile5]